MRGCLRVVTALAVGLALFVMPAAPTRSEGPGDWPMLGHDPARTGYNDRETALKPPLRLKWKYGAGGTSAPLVANGLVYLMTPQRLLALDAQSGAVRWSYDTSYRYGPGLGAVVGGWVYGALNTYPSIPIAEGRVYALDAQTGAPAWTYQTEDAILSHPAVAGGLVYVGTEGEPYALDAATGELRWTASWGNWGSSTPAVVDGVVYAGSGMAFALGAATGALKWSYQTADRIRPSAVAGGLVYFGSADGKVYALDAADGSLKWTYQAGRDISSLAVANGIVYAGSFDRKLHALDAATGSLLWTRGASHPLPWPLNTYEVYWDPSPPAVANGYVFVTFYDALYVLDATTGAVAWTYYFWEEVRASPAIANGILYLVSVQGNVYAFEPGPTRFYFPLAASRYSGGW